MIFKIFKNLILIVAKQNQKSKVINMFLKMAFNWLKWLKKIIEKVMVKITKKIFSLKSTKLKKSWDLTKNRESPLKMGMSHPQRNNKAAKIIMTMTQTRIIKEEGMKNKCKNYLITRQLFLKGLVNLKRLQTSLNTCIRQSKWGILKLRGSSFTSSACTLNVEVYSKSRAI
jgi:hypothetical protein